MVTGRRDLLDSSTTLFVVSTLAGALAACTGFGIGTILTPVLALLVGAKLAVAAVTLPHFFGTALRFASCYKVANIYLLKRFGLMSAAGAFIGALLHGLVSGSAVAIVIGALLIFTGMAGVGLRYPIRLERRAAWIAGIISGLSGGLAGNQGGIRSAALMGFSLEKTAFIATATGVGLIVDCARMPVYACTLGGTLLSASGHIFVMCAGVALGTLVGTGLAKVAPETLFRRLVSTAIMGLGLVMVMTNANQGALLQSVQNQVITMTGNGIAH